MDRSVAPAAYFIARINHESKHFLRQICRFLRSVPGFLCVLSGKDSLRAALARLQNSSPARDER
jgi:hypothetical protein